MPNFNTIAYTGTYNVGGANLLPQVGRQMVAYDKASVPLTTMMMNLKRISQTMNPTYFWYEGQYDDPSCNCTVPIVATGPGAPQTLTVNSLNIRAGDKLVEPTLDQLFEVITILGYNTGAGTAQFTALCVPSTIGAQAVSGTPLLIRAGNQMLEGDYWPDATSNIPLKFTNGISVIADSISVSNIMNDTPSFYNNGNEFDFQRTAKIEQFRKNMERTIIWSQFYQETRTHIHSGQTWTGTAFSTGGIIPGISTLVPYTGTLTESTLDGFLANTVWATRYYGSDFKIGFGGPQVFNDINGFAKNKMRYVGEKKMTYGLTVRTYIGYAGQELYLILEREFMNDNPSYANSLVVIDPLQIELKYHGPALMMLKNTTPPNQAVTSLGMESRPGVLRSFDKSAAILYKS
jgi:hypothetical protein